MNRSTSPDGGALHLMAWLSPAFPVGAFAYSHGLETAVDDGDVVDAPGLIGWLSDVARHGSLRTDAILAKAAWSAVSSGDAAGLRDINDLALALAPARERRLETAATGTAFVSAIRGAWPDAACPALPDGEVAYPVAFGAACAAQAVPLLGCLEAYAFAFLQNLVSAAVRLGPVGQTDGQRTLAALMPVARALAAGALEATLDDLGSCAFRADLSAVRHETLYSRLFRS